MSMSRRIALGEWLFASVFYAYQYILRVMPNIMLDRYGPKKIMPLCMELIVVRLLPIIRADNWIYAVIGRCLVGLGSAAAIMETFKIIRMIFQEKHFTRMISLSITIGLIEPIYGGGPISYMCKQLGYRVVVEIFLFLALLLQSLLI